jgi:hypothetical protein
MRLATLATLALATLAGPAGAAAPNMKEGLWEITTKTEMAGMPAAGMKPVVMTQCITKKDLEDPSKTTPGGDARCQVTDHKAQGNTASWNVACKGEGNMTGSGTITYGGTSYTGTSKVTMTHGGKPQTMTVHYAGKHLGECKK